MAAPSFSLRQRHSSLHHRRRTTALLRHVNDLLGFEIGDIRTGKMLRRVEVPGFKPGSVKRHECPSHGIGLTPDESELWLCDGANSHVHDGRFAIPSTGEVIDVRSKRITTTLSDEGGRPVQSEKLLEIVFSDGHPVRTGDQFGVGRHR